MTTYILEEVETDFSLIGETTAHAGETVAEFSVPQ